MKVAVDRSAAPIAATHEGFLVHAGFRYFRLALLLCLAAIAAYCGHSPMGGANGRSWLGYTLGTIGALLILWLTLLGWRKRRYSSNLGTVRGWASAHVYLGLSLIIIATLHTGFHFGSNIHTVAYVLMLLVIASGIYGIVAYTRYPTLITANRGQGAREAWLSEIDEIDDQSLKLADALDPEVHRVVARLVDRVHIGGGIRAQLFGPRGAERKSFDGINREPDLQSPVMFMASRLAGGVHDNGNLQKLLDLIARRSDLTARINRDIRLHARMQIWLYLHVPLTFALLAALTAHILSEFLYW